MNKPHTPGTLDSTLDQLRDLVAVADREGLYDAADWLRQALRSFPPVPVGYEAELSSQWIARARPQSLRSWPL